MEPIFAIKRMRKLTWCFGLILCCLWGCTKKSCSYRDDGVTAPDGEQSAIKHYLDSIGVVANLNARGFYYKIDSPGTGTTPGECSTIDVAYSGHLTNGTLFDQENSFTTQLTNLIDGWQLGVPLIKNGGSIRLYIPPSLGYGQEPISMAGGTTIPASSILIFDTHLLDVQ